MWLFGEGALGGSVRERIVGGRHLCGVDRIRQTVRMWREIGKKKDVTRKWNRRSSEGRNGDGRCDGWWLSPHKIVIVL